MADPKFRFYRVRYTNEVLPALRTPAGYEDDHPGDFEGVPDDQVPQDLLDKLTPKARPRSTDGETAPVAPTAPAVIAAPVAPSAPAGPIPPAPPIPPLPITGTDSKGD